MIRALLLFSVLVFSAQASDTSAVRFPGESFTSALARHSGDFRNILKNTPLDYDRPLSELNPLDVVDWSGVEMSAQAAFERIRDLRFLNDKNCSNFKRRLSWLYPDDGCFARAALAVKNLDSIQLPKPSKIFAFGNLEVKTTNSPLGRVSWWYHVVPAIRLGTQVIVFDPAIEPLRFLLVEEWVAKMGSVNNIKIAVCSPETYSPDDQCLGATDSGTLALADQSYYLNLEWDRLKTLKRPPESELGDFPPWLNSGSSLN